MARYSKNIKNQVAKKEKDKKNKIVTTAMLLFGIPIFVLIFIYLQASLMQVLLLAKAGQAAKNLGLPIDKHCLPYSTKCPPIGGRKKKAGTFDKGLIHGVASLVDDAVDVALPPQHGGGGPPTAAHGHTTYYSAIENKKKGFLSTTKFGFPYSLITSSRPKKSIDKSSGMDFVGVYFRTYWITVRSTLIGFLETVRSSLYENYDTINPPTTIQGQIGDFCKFAILLPLINGFISITHTLVNAGALFWSAINEQNLFALLLVPLSFLLFSPISALTTAYLTCFLFLPDKAGEKMKLFRKYGRRYKVCWAFIMILLWFITIGGVWEFSLPSVLLVGVVPTIVLLSSLVGFTDF